MTLEAYTEILRAGEACHSGYLRDCIFGLTQELTRPLEAYIQDKLLDTHSCQVIDFLI